LSANGVTPVRTAGDLLITFDFGGSGVPDLALDKWVTSGATSQCVASNTLPCWGNHVDLTSAGFAEGGVNATNITDNRAPGNPFSLAGNSSQSTFGEAGINITAANIFPANQCESFGSAYLKSRSSGSSFTSELKDFIAPIPVHISNCGTVIIHKHTDPRGVDQTFSFNSNVADNPATGTTDSGCREAGSGYSGSYTLNDAGNSSSDNGANTDTCTAVPTGSYTVSEGGLPTGFVFEGLSCSNSGGSTTTITGSSVAISVVPDGVTECTYTNQQQLGAIKITKTSSKGTHPGLLGAKFSIKYAGVAITGSPFTTDASGNICVGNLPFGTYSVQETQPPTGYSIDDTSAHDVVVGTNSTCGDGNEATFAATDTPLSDIQVNFRDGGSGATSGAISCDNSTGSSSTTAASGWDTSLTVTGVSAPTTIHCTITIDP
jgi:hypothetical protein